MPSCSCTCSDHNLHIQTVLHNLQAMSTSVFNLPSKTGNDPTQSKPHGLHSSISAISLVTNDIDTLNEGSEATTFHNFEMSAPPISSFSCPSLRSLLDTLDLSLPDNKAAYDTHNDQNNHSTGQADTKENNNKSSLLDKGETFDEKKSCDTNKTDYSHSNSKYISVSESVMPKANDSTCPSCNNFCCHQRLFAHEQELAAITLDGPDSISKGVTSSTHNIVGLNQDSASNKSKLNTVLKEGSNPKLAFDASTTMLNSPLTHITPMTSVELAEVLEFAGAGSPGSDLAEENVKTRREEMEAAKKFLASTATSGKTINSANYRGVSAQIQYTTEIPEIFLHPRKVLSKITKSILVKEKQDIKKQTHSHVDQSETATEDRNGGGSVSYSNNAKLDNPLQPDGSLTGIDKSPDAGSNDKDSNDNSQPNADPSQINAKEGVEVDIPNDAGKSALKKELSISSQIKHTKPPQSPPILPPQLSLAFLNASSGPGHGSNLLLNRNGSCQKSTTTLYELSTNNNSAGGSSSTTNNSKSIGQPPESKTLNSGSSIRPTAIHSSETKSTRLPSFADQSTLSSSTVVHGLDSSTACLQNGSTTAPDTIPLDPTSDPANQKSSVISGQVGTCVSMSSGHVGTMSTSSPATFSESATNSSNGPCRSTDTAMFSTSPDRALEQQYLNNPEPPKYMFTNLIDDEDPDVLDNQPSHVTLNHLATMHLKNNVLAVACTSRYGTKYITQILYRPM